MSGVRAEHHRERDGQDSSTISAAASLLVAGELLDLLRESS